MRDRGQGRGGVRAGEGQGRQGARRRASWAGRERRAHELGREGKFASIERVRVSFRVRTGFAVRAKNMHGKEALCRAETDGKGEGARQIDSLPCTNAQVKDCSFSIFTLFGATNVMCRIKRIYCRLVPVAYTPY